MTASAATELVTGHDRLVAVAARLATAPVIAVDTEFVRRTTFFARPGLLQLSAGDGEFLVDLVALPDITPLRDLFLSVRPLKVMHSCSEDLEVLRGLFGAVPGSLATSRPAFIRCRSLLCCSSCQSQKVGSPQQTRQTVD